MVVGDVVGAAVVSMGSPVAQPAAMARSRLSRRRREICRFITDSFLKNIAFLSCLKYQETTSRSSKNIPTGSVAFSVKSC
jgi:hypothetical protein